MSTRRFSKAQVSEWARGRMDRLSENYSFDLNKGWAQVDRSLPTDIEHRKLERNRAYGEVMALQALLDSFEL